MDRAQADPISLQRNVILGVLLVLAAAAWAELVWQGAGGDMNMAMDSPTMGLRAPLFLAIWVIMMVAMMFPTAAPMIVTFHKVQAGKRQRGEAFVSTWIFVAAYLLIWGLSGACRLCRRARRRGDCRAHGAVVGYRGPHRRRRACRGRFLPIHAVEEHLSL
jgi:predicted metal-binding membrane protein